MVLLLSCLWPQLRHMFIWQMAAKASYILLWPTTTKTQTHQVHADCQHALVEACGSGNVSANTRILLTSHVSYFLITENYNILCHFDLTIELNPTHKKSNRARSTDFTSRSTCAIRSFIFFNSKLTQNSNKYVVIECSSHKK